jgi:hypothetical protein
LPAHTGGGTVRPSSFFLLFFLAVFFGFPHRGEIANATIGAISVAGDIRFGYKENVVGFRWTNGAFLEFLAGLTGS